MTFYLLNACTGLRAGLLRLIRRAIWDIENRHHYIWWI